MSSNSTVAMGTSNCQSYLHSDHLRFVPQLEPIPPFSPIEIEASKADASTKNQAGQPQRSDPSCVVQQSSSQDHSICQYLANQRAAASWLENDEAARARSSTFEKVLARPILEAYIAHGQIKQQEDSPACRSTLETPIPDVKWTANQEVKGIDTLLTGTVSTGAWITEQKGIQQGQTADQEGIDHHEDETDETNESSNGIHEGSQGTSGIHDGHDLDSRHTTYICPPYATFAGKEQASSGNTLQKDSNTPPPVPPKVPVSVPQATTNTSAVASARIQNGEDAQTTVDALSPKPQEHRRAYTTAKRKPAARRARRSKKFEPTLSPLTETSYKSFASAYVPQPEPKPVHPEHAWPSQSCPEPGHFLSGAPRPMAQIHYYHQIHAASESYGSTHPGIITDVVELEAFPAPQQSPLASRTKSLRSYPPTMLKNQMYRQRTRVTARQETSNGTCQAKPEAAHSRPSLNGPVSGTATVEFSARTSQHINQGPATLNPSQQSHTHQRPADRCPCSTDLDVLVSEYRTVGGQRIKMFADTMPVVNSRSESGQARAAQRTTRPKEFREQTPETAVADEHEIEDEQIVLRVLPSVRTCGFDSDSVDRFLLMDLELNGNVVRTRDAIWKGLIANLNEVPQAYQAALGTVTAKTMASAVKLVVKARRAMKSAED